MRRLIKRFCGVLVLAAVMVVPLLLVAGPALAVSPFEGNPPGKQIDGKHDINGRLIETGRLYFGATYIERVFYDVRSSDPHLTGKMILDVTYAYPNANLNVVFGGKWKMFAGPDEPHWDDPTIWEADFEGLESANYVFGKPFQLSVSGEAQGTGVNVGSTLHYRVHRASADPKHPSKSTLILKARIDE